MRCLLVALIVACCPAAAGCGADDDGSSGPCGSDGDCPDGRLCVDGECRDPSVGDPIIRQFRVTWYGWPDNSCGSGGGACIARSVIHDQAGGIGTYADPITYAAASPSSWRYGGYGTILYVPFIQRYVILEDSCGGCEQDQIDIWLNSDENFEAEVLACEGALTRRSTDVELNPPPGRPVEVMPLFDTASGTCHAPD